MPTIPEDDLELLDQLARARSALNAQIARRIIGQRDTPDNLVRRRGGVTRPSPPDAKGAKQGAECPATCAEADGTTAKVARPKM